MHTVVLVIGEEAPDDAAAIACALGDIARAKGSECPTQVAVGGKRCADLAPNCIYGLVDREADCIYSLLMVTWDESKRLTNLRKHRIDLATLGSVFDSPMITVEDEREGYGELRLQSLGFWQGRVIFLVWTPRGDDTAHLISCRYADRKEIDDYFGSL